MASRQAGQLPTSPLRTPRCSAARRCNVRPCVSLWPAQTARNSTPGGLGNREGKGRYGSRAVSGDAGQAAAGEKSASGRQAEKGRESPGRASPTPPAVWGWDSGRGRGRQAWPGSAPSRPPCPSSSSSSVRSNLASTPCTRVQGRCRREPSLYAAGNPSPPPSARAPASACRHCPGHPQAMQTKACDSVTC